MALLTKIALLSILIRIFSPYKSKILFIYVFLGCLGIYYTIAEVVKIRMCDPVPAYWDLRASASCLDQRAALIADSVISVISDLIILILPLPLTWSLQMSRNKKLRVVGMLSAGGLATAFSVYRLVLVVKDGGSADQTIMFTCVILSGYVPFSTYQMNFPTDANKQKRRRRRRTDLYLPADLQHRDPQTALESLQLEPVLPARVICPTQQDESQRRQGLLDGFETRPRLRKRPEPPDHVCWHCRHGQQRRRNGRIAGYQRHPHPQDGRRVADGGGHGRA